MRTCMQAHVCVLGRLSGGAPVTQAHRARQHAHNETCNEEAPPPLDYRRERNASRNQCPNNMASPAMARGVSGSPTSRHLARKPWHAMVATTTRRTPHSITSLLPPARPSPSPRHNLRDSSTMCRPSHARNPPSKSAPHSCDNGGSLSNRLAQNAITLSPSHAPKLQPPQTLLQSLPRSAAHLALQVTIAAFSAWTLPSPTSAAEPSQPTHVCARMHAGTHACAVFGLSN